MLNTGLRAFALSSILAFGFMTQMAAAQNFDTRSIINVAATGDQSIAPDLAYLTLSVLREAPTAREALDANSTSMTEILAAMKAFGIAERDLQTSGFSINPIFVYPRAEDPQTPPKITGYQVTNGLTVRVRELAKLGEIIDQSVTLGVNSGTSITFGNDNPAEAIKAARLEAMKEALEKAKTLVEAGGAKLGKIISISESSNAPQPVAMLDMARSSDMAPKSVPIAGGENSYSVNVNVAYEILQ